MSPDISLVRFERLRCIGRLVYRRQGLLREWGSFVAFLRLTSPEMGPSSKFQARRGTRGGEELETLTPVATKRANEVGFFRSVAPRFFRID